MTSVPSGVVFILAEMFKWFKLMAFSTSFHITSNELNLSNYTLNFYHRQGAVMALMTGAAV